MRTSKTASPWSRYEPTPDDPWDVRKVAHLHRRAGFGATRAELLRDVAENREIGDATTLADSSVMDLIASKLPSAASED